VSNFLSAATVFQKRQLKGASQIIHCILCIRWAAHQVCIMMVHWSCCN